MHASTAIALLGASLVTARNVLNLDISKPKLTPEERLQRRIARRATITEPLGNADYLYYANVSVGSPPQMLQLQVDTGSSDVWMTSSTAAFCVEDPDNCLGGTFDKSESSTYNLVGAGEFSIQYVDNTGSEGDFFTDNFLIGPADNMITITDQQLGLATRTTIGTGIIGVGFAADESVCSGSAGECDTYPTIVEQMVSQKKINSKAYSLWLNDLDANTGNILFGGIDKDKYTGQLVTLPIQPDSQSGSITSFTVAWTNFTLGTPDGPQGGFVSNNFAQPAILDSGTTLMLVPDDLAEKIYTEFGAQVYGRAGIYIAPCNLRSSTATFDFQFGGSNGPTIRVPINELLLDAGTDAYGQTLTFDNGDEACELGVEAAGDRPILFGDTFLRSAYVVYDLDNSEVSIAQTDFNATTSDIQEIQAGKKGVPDVASTASGATVEQSATGLGGLFGFGQTSAEAATPTPLASSDFTGAPLAQYTAVNTNSPQQGSGGGSNGGSPSTAAAASGPVIGPTFLRVEGLCMGALVSAFVAVGGGLVLL